MATELRSRTPVRQLLEETNENRGANTNSAVHHKHNETSSILVKALTTFSVNFAFGFLLQKGGVYIPQAIQEQFTFQNFSMLKMFLSAVATSQLSMSLLSLLPRLKERFYRVQQQYALGHHSSRGLNITSAGASILGMGMALCGTCPGTINAQLGSGVSTSYFVLAGSLVGALIYANLQTTLNSVCHLGRTRSKTVPEKLGTSYLVPATAFAAMEIGVVYGLYQYFPGEKVPMANVLNLNSVSWPVYATGVGIGLLQIPSVLILEQPLGASGNLASIVALLNRIPLLNRLVPSKSDLGKVHLLGKQSMLRWLAVCSAIAGGCAASFLSGNYGAVPGLEVGYLVSHSPLGIKLQAFFGGIALMLGARIAGGCTSGHGISGFGLLVINSVAAVPSMFGSAIITANLLKALH